MEFYQNGETFGAMCTDESETMETDVIINVDRDTENPTRCWDRLKVRQSHKKVKLLPLNTPVYEDKMRFVCMSDTHSKTRRLPPGWIPPGDVFLHGGDFTNQGRMQEVEEFNHFLGCLPHRHKVVIAGNHELTFDEGVLKENTFSIDTNALMSYWNQKGIQRTSQLLTNCIYLEDSEVVIGGIRIYGSPWQPEFCGWGFNLPRGQMLLEKWNMIPEDIDILMTHGPALGHGDVVRGGQNTGCVELLHTIQKRVKPKFHVCGHIHEGYGVTSDGFTTFINASSCNLRYSPENPPVIFDLAIPSGYTKGDVTVLPAVKKSCDSGSKSRHASDSDCSITFMEEATGLEEMK